MQSVGVRELKNRLSHFLRAVQAGERVLVTDRGKVVAELREPGSLEDGAVPPALATLARSGYATLASSSKVRYPKLRPLTRGPSSQKLLDAERAEHSEPSARAER